MTGRLGVARVFTTHGRVGAVHDSLAVVDALAVCRTRLQDEPACLVFEVGTRRLAPGEGVEDEHGVLHEGDPFTVWVFEVWTDAASRDTARARHGLDAVEAALAPHLAFPPEEGVALDLRGP